MENASISLETPSLADGGRAASPTDGWVTATASPSATPASIRSASPSPPPGIKVEEPSSNEEAEPKPYVKQCDRYLLDYQRWNKKEYKWIPYDPDSYIPPPPPKRDLDNYFHVKVQYQVPASKPALVISDWSDKLLHFMRSLIGDNFFYDSPEEDVKTFFPLMTKLRSRLEKCQKAATFLDENRKEARSTGKLLGYDRAGDDTVSDDCVRDYLSGLAIQMAVLVNYLEEQYRPIADKLALLNSYGHIEFDLLVYFFQEGDHITTVNEGQSVCFIVSERSYFTDYHGKRHFKVTGDGRYWDGYRYSRYEIERTISEYPGTRETSKLACQHLTAELKQTLQERGRLYTALSGMHYRLYLGDRVIVDRLAYDEQGGYVRDPGQVIREIDAARLHLLPHEVYGFNLARKRWNSFDVAHVQEVVFDENSWDHLVLDSDTKTLIKALVRVTQNSNTSTKIVSDVISGKGGGLISVLHGPPGTGKTLTAESVAELLKRPLYMVGSSELSTNPAQLETNLRSILSLATAWDAVLLIDEADVLLEQRSMHELERNTLVSVALRVLEYHRGVLFLTTNRIKTFDEAFLSRFSIAIKYPELDQAGRFAVWRKFFALAGCTFPKTTSVDDPGATHEQIGITITNEQLETLAAKPFNGRTIKNIVRTAQALALSTEEDISMKHVEIVLRAQERFLDDFASIRV